MPVKTVSHNPTSAGVATNGWEHRSRLSGWPTVTVAGADSAFGSVPAAVARKISAKEVARTPKAKDKMDSEWGTLGKNGVWDLSGVRSWREVAEEAAAKGTKAHRGNVFGLCFEKGVELPEGHPDRKLKGRHVFQGNLVKDEHQEAALFNELGSSPANLEGAKAVDCFGSFPGHLVEQADAKKAYNQALLGTTTPGSSVGPEGLVACKVNVTTWVTLPPECRPKTADGKDVWFTNGHSRSRCPFG